MISLRKYLMAGKEEEALQELFHVIQLLIQGIGLHAIMGDPAEYERFRADIQALQDSLTDECSSSQIAFTAGAVVKAMAAYSQRTSGYISKQGTELQNMVAMLTRTVVAISGGNERTLNRLQEIEKQIKHVSALDDMRTLKLRLENCLEHIQEEIEEHKQQSAHTVSDLSAELERSRERMEEFSTAPTMDIATGLPARAEAEKALEALTSRAGRAFAVVAVVNRIQLINARFGFTIGDQVLNEYGHHLRSGLAPADQLFRWSGPSFLALIERQDPIERVRTELNRFLGTTIEKMVDASGRSVMLPISATWSILPKLPTAKLLIRSIDAFVRKQSPET